MVHVRSRISDKSSKRETLEDQIAMVNRQFDFKEGVKVWDLAGTRRTTPETALTRFRATEMMLLNEVESCHCRRVCDEHRQATVGGVGTEDMIVNVVRKTEVNVEIQSPSKP